MCKFDPFFGSRVKLFIIQKLKLLRLLEIGSIDGVDGCDSKSKCGNCVLEVVVEHIIHFIEHRWVFRIIGFIFFIPMQILSTTFNAIEKAN